MRAIVARTSRSRHPRVHPVEIIFRHDDDAAHPHPIFAKSHSLLMGNCASTRGSRTHTHTHIVKNCVCVCVCAVVLCGPARPAAAAETLDCACGKIIYDQYLLNRWIFVCRSDRRPVGWFFGWPVVSAGVEGGFVRASASQFRIGLIVACDMWKCHNALVNAVFFLLFIGHTKSSCNISDRHT